MCSKNNILASFISFIRLVIFYLKKSFMQVIQQAKYFHVLHFFLLSFNPWRGFINYVLNRHKAHILLFFYLHISPSYHQK